MSKDIEVAICSYEEFSEWDHIPYGSFYIRNAMIENEENFKVINSEEIQLESLVQFASALGYESCWSLEGKLQRFKQPRFRCIGKEYISVRNMIKLHNTAAEDIFEHLGSVDMSFKEFLNTDFGEDLFTVLFAGSCKIVEVVKAQYSRKRGGFFLHPTKTINMVKFMTKKDEAQYKHFLMQEE